MGLMSSYPANNWRKSASASGDDGTAGRGGVQVAKFHPLWRNLDETKMVQTAVFIYLQFFVYSLVLECQVG